MELGLPVFSPERIRQEPATQADLSRLEADVSVVVAFGQILPQEVLDQPPLGCWNGHGSLLPRWRGAGPIQWSLLEGDAETGVGIMAMEAGLDTGPVLMEQHLPIGLLENSHQLATRLAGLTGQLLVEAMTRIEAAGPGSPEKRLARLHVRPQSAEGVTYARRLTKEDHMITWHRSALTIHRQVMGLFPGAQALWQGKRLKVLATEPIVERLQEQLTPAAADLCGRWPTGSAAPGTVLEVITGTGLVVATHGCPLLIREAQLEGKSVQRGSALIQQLGARPGDQLAASSPPLDHNGHTP